MHIITLLIINLLYFCILSAFYNLGKPVLRFEYWQLGYTEFADFSETSVYYSDCVGSVSDLVFILDQRQVLAGYKCFLYNSLCKHF